jgi:hypothetical protein
MRKVLFILAFISAQLHLDAQIDSSFHNSLYFEVLGNSTGLLSANYEHIFGFPHSKTIRLVCRIGFGITNKSVDSSEIYTVPLEITGLVGKGKHLLEFGVGYTPGFGTSNLKSPTLPPNDRLNFYYAYLFRIGYRLVTGDRMFFRIAPLLELLYNNATTKKPDVQILPSVSVGFTI